MKHTTVAFALGILAATLGIGAASDSDINPGSKIVLVEVNGKPLTLADVEQKKSAALFQARTNYYEAQRKIIEDFVDDYLLEQQAKKEGVTVAELLDRHVNKTIAKDPTDEALRVYYEGVDTTEPFEAVKDKIVDALRQRRIAKAKSAYQQSIRAQAQMTIRLGPPRAPITMKDVPLRGASAPALTLLEFADYECPYCQQIQPTLERIEKEFKGKLSFGYKDYPLGMHANAQKAAEAAHCAGNQAKYWEYHDALLTNRQLDVASLKKYSRDLKLDTAAFDTCLDKGQEAGRVKTSLDEAMGLGLQGTPSLLLNGRYISGNLTYEKIRSVIVEELSSIEGSASPAASSSPRNQ